MKKLLIILLSLISLKGFSQFEKSNSILLFGNLNIPRKGLGYNDIGVGAGFSTSFFGKHRLQALIEANANYFYGDKTYFIDATGKGEKNAAVHSIKAGSQFFVVKNIAVSVTYGVGWYAIHDFRYSIGNALKYSITGFPETKKHFVTQLFYTNVSTTGYPIRFIGLAAGYRF